MLLSWCGRSRLNPVHYYVIWGPSITRYCWDRKLAKSHKFNSLNSPTDWIHQFRFINFYRLPSFQYLECWFKQEIKLTRAKRTNTFPSMEDGFYPNTGCSVTNSHVPCVISYYPPIAFPGFFPLFFLFSYIVLVLLIVVPLPFSFIPPCPLPPLISLSLSFSLFFSLPSIPTLPVIYFFSSFLFSLGLVAVDRLIDRVKLRSI